MMNLYTQENRKITFYDKSHNFIIETYKKKNINENISNMLNETVMSKK